MPSRPEEYRTKRRHPTAPDWDDPPMPSTVIRHVDDLIATGRKLIIIRYMRVSTTDQRQQGNLANRRSRLWKELRERGVRTTRGFNEVACGQFLRGRGVLVEALELARRLQKLNPDAEVAVVTDTRNRFIRGPHYNGLAQTDQPTAAQLKELAALAGGVTLATVLHPDAIFSDVRSYETNVPTSMGEASGKRVGRPRKQPPLDNNPDYDERFEKEESAIHFAREGMSKRRIAKCLGVVDGTIRYWFNRRNAMQDRVIFGSCRVRKSLRM